MSKPETDRARTALAQGKLDLCEQICSQLLSKDPRSTEAFDLLSRCAAARRDFSRAALFGGRFLAVAESQPREKAEMHARIAGYQKMLGGLGEAEKNYRAAIELAPALPVPRALFCTFLFDCGRFDEAREEAAALLDNLVNFTGTLSAPDDRHLGLALYLASQLAERGSVDDWLARLQSVKNSAPLSALAEQPGLNYALGTLSDRSGDYPSALDFFHRANQLRRRESGYRIDPVLEQMRHISRMFTPEFFASTVRAEAAAGDPRVVFIVGMPRSGTSLVEQILSSHSAVRPLGESPCLSQAVAAAFKARPECQPARPDSLDAAFFTDIRRRYLKAIDCKPGPRVITDKMPGNLAYAWAISKAFPDGRLIICQREKNATVLSCYTTNFALQHGFSEDLSDCARYFEQSYRMLAQWRPGLSSMSREQSYEALVTRPQAEIAGLLDHVGLEHEDRCFSPHENRRIVNTASRLQVTRPIHAGANDRWAPYIELLGDRL